MEIYEQILSSYGESELLPDVFFSRGYALQLQEDGRAGEDYARMVADYPDHPATPNALLQLARIDLEAGNYETAQAIYQRLIETYPESNTVNSAKMERGLCLKNTGDLSSAIASFESIDPQWGQWAKVQAELADLYVRSGDQGTAKNVLSKALDVVQDDDVLSGQLLYVKSRIHFTDKEYREAIAGFSEVLEFPVRDDIYNGSLLSRGSALYELAKALDAKGDTSLARVEYEASLVDMKALLDRNPAANIKDSAFRTLGAGMIRLQREDEAVRYYKELIASSEDPQQRATFQMLLMELYFDQQKFEQSEVFARELLNMDFEDNNSAGYFRKERAYSLIGNSLIQKKDFTVAKSLLGIPKYPKSGESATQLFPRHSPISIRVITKQRQRDSLSLWTNILTIATQSMVNIT